MEQVTIEGILDRPLLKLVKDAPANRMTRGQVRAATNLVIPDGVNTTEGIIEYVLENYDKDKAPKQGWVYRTYEPESEFTHERAARHREEREQRAQREEMLDREAVVVTECEASERRTYDTVESYSAMYHVRVRFERADFVGCSNKQEVISMMMDKAREQMYDEGISDEEHIDTEDSEFRDSHDFEHNTNYETLWDQNKEAIAASLGMTPEEME
jgi:hypothetical protein